MAADTDRLYCPRRRCGVCLLWAKPSLSRGSECEPDTFGGPVHTELEVENYLETTIGAFAPNVSAETTIDNGMVTSVVTIPVNDLIATNIITSLMNFDLTVGATHFVEF